MRQLTEHIDIEAPTSAVWHTLSDFGGVARWAPYLRAAAVVGAPEHGVGSYRVLRHFWGFRLEEAVVEWTDHQGYTFDVVVAPFPIGGVRETWALQGGSPHVTVTTTVSYGMRLAWLGSLLDWLLVRHLIRREMRAGLRALRRYVESR